MGRLEGLWRVGQAKIDANRKKKRDGESNIGFLQALAEGLKDEKKKEG